MQYFLLTYDRSAGKLVGMREFGSDERHAALMSRFELERKYRNRPEYEVVVLAGRSLEAVKKTHGRYFKNFNELAASGF